MFFSKTTVFLAFVAVAKLAVAAAPGCLLGAINEYTDPADISAVCKSKDYQSKIVSFCGDKAEDALSAFADVCLKAGVKVATEITASGTVSGTAKASGTGSPSGASTLASATVTGNNPPAAGVTSSTATGSGAPQSTGAAGKLEVGTAALLAGFGILAAAF